MDHAINTIHRRSVLLLGAAGVGSALFGTPPRAVAAGMEEKELAPGVKLKVLAEAPSTIPGFPKARLMVATFEAGSKFGPQPMKTAMVCEISEAPLERTIEGGAPVMLQPGDIYTCHPGLVETTANTGTATSVMRIVELLSA